MIFQNSALNRNCLKPNVKLKDLPVNNPHQTLVILLLKLILQKTEAKDFTYCWSQLKLLVPNLARQIPSHFEFNQQQTLEEFKVDRQIIHDFYEQKVLDTPNQQGAFYTPKHIVELVYKNICINKESTILDPACGTGIFLESALEKITSYEEQEKYLLHNIFGFDLDPLACEVSRILLCCCLENLNLDKFLMILKSFTNNIQTSDFLLLDQIKEFDLIVGNPPYGLSRDQQISIELNKIYRKKFDNWISGKGNKYLYFIAKSLELLKTNAELAFIIPNSWTGLDSFRKFRSNLIQQNLLKEVIFLPANAFNKLGVETTILVLSKKNQNTLIVGNTDFNHKINYEDLVAPDYRIPSFHNQELVVFTNSFLKQSKRLGNNHKFQIKISMQAYMLGKGTPPQKATDIKNHIFHFNYKKSDNCLKYLQGRDLKPASIVWSGNYLEYGAHLAEYQANTVFNLPRVLIREIAGQFPNLITAVASEQEYIYNRSILQIICKDLRQAQALAALLMSKPVAAYFKIHGRKTQRKLFPKLVLNDLKDFPLADCFDEHIESLNKYYNIISSTGKIPQDLDELCCEMYNCDLKQIKNIIKC